MILIGSNQIYIFFKCFISFPFSLLHDVRGAWGITHNFIALQFSKSRLGLTWEYPGKSIAHLILRSI